MLKRVECLDLGCFELSAPSKRESLLNLHRRLHPVSLLVCDSSDRVVFGHVWLRNCPKDQVLCVQCADLLESDAWLLSYHLLESFQQVSLYEQLKLWSSVSGLIPLTELRRHISLPFSLSEEVQSFLPDLFESPLLENLERDEMVWQVLFRILVRDRSEWPGWSRLFAMAQFSRSRQIALLDVVEEIVFRDKCSVDHIVDRLSGQTEKSADRGELIWNSLFGLRYPKTEELEARWLRQVEGLGLPQGFTIRHAPFFESEDVNLSARFADFTRFSEFWKGRA